MLLILFKVFFFRGFIIVKYLAEEDLEELLINVYPNPANDYINISVEGLNKNSGLMIFSPNGSDL